MAIEQEYIDKIEEIKQHDDQLTDWEKVSYSELMILHQ